MTTGDSESPSSHSHSRGDSGSDVPSSKSTSVARNGVKESSSTTKSRKADNTRIIQVANIAPQATREQMQTLFGYIGKIDDLRLYPTMDLGMHVSSKICFVKFYESSCVGIAQHMTNTVFIDRALIVIPYIEGEIPDEQKALDLLGSGTLLPGIADPKLPQHVTSQLEGIPPHQVVITTDPKLTENQLPAYPPLPPTYDTRKIEEIRRTVVIANVDSELGSQEAVDYFSQAGEVKYYRFCTRDNDPLHYALIEFSDQPSILDAIHLNGTKLGSKHIKVYHSTQAIIKPQAKTNEAAQKEIEEAMSRQAQSLLSQGLDGSGKDKRRSRSRSRSRRRSRSRGRARRSRSRSKSHRRSRSRSHRSRSRHRSSSKHRETRSHRSKPKKSRSHSKTRKRSRSRKRSKSHGRSRKSRSRSHSKRSRSRSKRRDEKKKLKREDKKKIKKEKERDKKEKDRDRSERAEKSDKDKDRDHKENGLSSSSKHDEKMELVASQKD